MAGWRLQIGHADGSRARIRNQLDRQTEQYKAIYKQRAAVERVFSRTVAYGIERPKLRNAAAIANQNTLIYLLLNVRAWLNVLKRSAADSLVQRGIEAGCSKGQCSKLKVKINRGWNFPVM